MFVNQILQQIALKHRDIELSPGVALLGGQPFHYIQIRDRYEMDFLGRTVEQAKTVWRRFGQRRGHELLDLVRPIRRIRHRRVVAKLSFEYAEIKIAQPADQSMRRQDEQAVVLHGDEHEHAEIGRMIWRSGPLFCSSISF